MTEPDVTLTDYALALEGFLFLGLLQRGQGRPAELRSWFALFFASMSAASLCGGTVHGFFLDKQTVGYAILWPTTLLALFLLFLGGRWLVGAVRDRTGEASREVQTNELQHESTSL